MLRGSDHEHLDALISAIDQITNNWEQGDLATAVNEAQAVADEARAYVQAELKMGRDLYEALFGKQQSQQEVK
jgi:hypothetical protein